MSKAFRRAGGAWAFLLGGAAQLLQAEIIHETAQSGFTGQTSGSGYTISADFFLASNFQVTETVETGRVGGHFTHFEDGDVFGALVRVTGPTDFVRPADLEGDDLLGATRITPPYPSAHVSGNLRVTLTPGWYAVVFGSGRFGTSGEAGALLGNPNDGAFNVYSVQVSDGRPLIDDPGVRLFVDTAPLPTFRTLYEVGQKVVLPEYSAEFLSFSDPALDGEDMCFDAQADSYALSRAVYKRVNGVLSLVAGLGWAIPDAGTTTFNYFAGQCVIDQGNVAFVGQGGASLEGVYTDLDGGLRRVIDSTMSIPGGVGTFQLDQGALPSMEGGRITFVGRFGTPSAGIYVWEDGQIEVIANGDTMIPGHTSLFEYFDVIAPIDDGVTAFGAGTLEGSLSAPPSGLYRTNDAGLETLYQDGTPMPGGGIFGSFGFARMRRDRLAFIAFDHTRTLLGAFTDASGELRALLRSDVNLPEAAEPLGSLRIPAFDGRHVALVAQGATSRSGLYADVVGETVKVIRRNDIVFGKTVSSVSASPFALERNRIVFRASYTDLSQAIVEARYPAPPGDVDDDGHGDLFDLALLANCFTAASGEVTDPHCSAADFNGDTDVDLGDYAEWLRCADGASNDSRCAY